MFCGMVCKIQMERHVRTGHDVDIDKHFAIGRVALRIPSFAMIISRAVAADNREVGRYVLFIQRLDLLNGCPARTLRIAGACISITISIESITTTR